MNGTKALFAAAASAAALATHAAAPRWFVVNEDNDHFFKCNSALMDEKGLSDYVDYICRGKVTHVFFCVCGQRTSYDSKTWEPIWKGLDEAARPDTATRPDGTHDCVFDGFGGSLLQVKTNERRGGFVRDVRMERVEARGRLLGSMLSVSMDAMFQWRDFPTHEVRVSDISGIRISDVHVERAGRRVSIREDARKPVRDVVLDNVVVDKVDLQDLREPVRKTMPE